MAAAAGAPTLGLFGPSDERLYGPWGDKTCVARGPRSFVQIKVKDPELSQPVCHMLDLPVPQVLADAKALFEATQPPASARRGKGKAKKAAEAAADDETATAS